MKIHESQTSYFSADAQVPNAGRQSDFAGFSLSESQQGEIRQCTEAIERGHKIASHYRDRGIAYQKVAFATDNFEAMHKAVADFSAAIELDNDVEAYYGRANCFLRLERLSLELAAKLASDRSNQAESKALSVASESNHEINSTGNGDSHFSRAFVYARLARQDLRLSRGLSRWTARKDFKRLRDLIWTQVKVCA